MSEHEDMAWMRRAIALAREAETTAGTNPIGCVIVKDGECLAEGCNEVDRQFDATAHAEIVTMRRAGAALRSQNLRGTTLYTTLQPCGMCTMASIWAGIGRIVFGAGREDVHRMYFEDRHLDTVDFIRDAFHDDIAHAGGILAQECAQLYRPPDGDRARRKR
jgi:tRNA(adenine34) deaminase